MKRASRQVEDWTIGDLYAKRQQLQFPEYQRQPNLWPEEKKSLLIDSILRDIDIPKLYFNQLDRDVYEVVDGQQRLWAIWDFLDDGYTHKSADGSKRFSELAAAQRKWIRDYKLQVTVFSNAEEDYLRELFVRLQLGLLLITGEKLHAATGQMRDFVFKRMRSHDFIETLAIPERRYARETLCAQVCINSFTLAKQNCFARTRYDDLHFFFREYQDPKGEDGALFKKQLSKIIDTLDILQKSYGARSKGLRNRSFILSIYLFFEQHLADLLASASARSEFVKFTFVLWDRLKSEASLGIDRSNRELYSFETMLSSAPGERYQIERRHAKLLEYFEHFVKSGTIKGDRKHA